MQWESHSFFFFFGKWWLKYFQINLFKKLLNFYTPVIFNYNSKIFVMDIEKNWEKRSRLPIAEWIGWGLGVPRGPKGSKISAARSQFLLSVGGLCHGQMRLGVKQSYRGLCNLGPMCSGRYVNEHYIKGRYNMQHFWTFFLTRRTPLSPCKHLMRWALCRPTLGNTL